MGHYGVIDFDEEEINAAGHWYGGQGSMLYAILSTGALSRGTIRPKHRDGTPMTDEEWMIDLAERLESEADAAARDAKKQAKKAKGDEKKELLADVEGLHGISLKAADYIRQMKLSVNELRPKKSPSSAHARKKSFGSADQNQYGSGRYIVRAQNRSDTYRFTNKDAAKVFARTLALESMKASVYDDKTGAHWPIASFVREPSGRVIAVAV